MPPLSQPRPGKLLRIKDRPLEFSFWPVERRSRRYGLGTRVFATDPWTVIRRSLERRCPKSRQSAGMALLEQAEDFYIAAESGVKAARPLLLYYCFMNLGKAFLLTCGQRPSVDNARHGLSEWVDPPPNDQELVNAHLGAYRSTSTTINLFGDLLFALTGSRLRRNQRYELIHLMPQVVPGHRLWVESKPENGKERFVSLERVEIWQDSTAKRLWFRLYLFADDLRRIEIGHQEVLDRSRLASVFREVASYEHINNRPLICFEQANAMSYGHRPSDQVQALILTIRHHLWRTILNAPTYRKYYIYPAPEQEHPEILPQVLSIYAITFYLGSIVRYRPHLFDRILGGSYGPFIEAFLNDQPAQFIYLMASEFAEREVTRAAIV